MLTFKSAKSVDKVNPTCEEIIEIINSNAITATLSGYLIKFDYKDKSYEIQLNNGIRGTVRGRLRTDSNKQFFIE